MSDFLDDNFIDVLLNETCALEDEKKVEQVEVTNVVNLRDYFERKVNEVEYLNLHHYLTDNEIQFVTLALMPETNCYRMTLADQTFDFPKNWSVFEQLEKVTYFQNEEDQDYLNDVFSELVGYSYQLAFINENNKSEMIFVPAADIHKCHEWFLAYTKKKDESKIAA
ncbi:MAG: hypothetical protein L6Q33_09890 [Bacteriovoracaceae bacterium]|jgi:hypothetical protein|nr:hypothetical protein [Bacteriovoracaceae bacterium]